MDIIINEKDKYEKKINKYFLKLEKYKRLAYISNIFYVSAWICIMVFFAFLFIHSFMLISKSNNSFFLNGMIICVITGIFIIISFVLCEIGNVRLSWKEKIYCKIKENELLGFHPVDIRYWMDDDKIRAYIYFKNDDEDIIKNYIRLDDFKIENKDCEDIVLNIDSSLLIFPISHKNKQFEL